MTEQSNEQTKHQVTPKSKLSEAAILAAIPLLAYLVIFVYEWGYFQVFRLPLQFVNFDIAEVFLVIVSLLIFIVAVLMLVNLIFKPYFEQKLPEPVLAKLSSTIPFYMGFIALWIIYGKIMQEAVPYVLGTLLFTLYLFLPPLLTKRVKGNYLEKLKALDEIQQQERLKNISTSFANRILNSLFNLLGRDVTLGIIYFLMGLFVIYQAGRAQALTQTYFRVVNTMPEAVVLYTKADRVIVAPFNRQTHEIEPVYQVIDYASDPSLEYRLEEIGPLYLKALKPSASPTPTPTLILTPVPTLTSTPIPTLNPTVEPTFTPLATSSPSPSKLPQGQDSLVTKSTDG